MPEWVIELFVSRTEADRLDGYEWRLRLAAAELSRERGMRVRYLRRIHLPRDETCLLLLHADSQVAVEEAVRRAEVPFERVIEAG